MTTLARHQFTVQDNAGNVVPGAHVEVRSETLGQPLAALYSDRDGSIGISNPSDADSDGFFYFHVEGGAYQIRVYTGASGAPTTEVIWRYVAIGLNAESDVTTVRSQRIVTAAGAVTVSATDADDILINKTSGAATTVNLPTSASRSRNVKIVDAKGDATTNNITIVPQSGEKIWGTVDYQAIIDGNGGVIELSPRADGTGWY
jgi:hypothetical protein